MGRTLRQARARVTEAADKTTTTQAKGTDGHDGATETSINEGVRGDDTESASREDAAGEGRKDYVPNAATGKAGRDAEGMDTSGEDNAMTYQFRRQGSVMTAEKKWKEIARGKHEGHQQRRTSFTRPEKRWRRG